MTKREAVKAARITLNQLYHILNQGLLVPRPAKDRAGHYVWTAEDVERLRQVSKSIRTYRHKKREAMPMPPEFCAGGRWEFVEDGTADPCNVDELDGAVADLLLDLIEPEVIGRRSGA
jgi:hypothetical protein